jgi:multidrug efflux pump subunit AcrA (membrane-fusion protein)
MALEPVAAARRLPALSTTALAPAEAARATGYAVRPVTYTDAIRAPAWVESRGVLVAQLHVDDLGDLEPGTRGTFSPASAPSAGFAAVVGTDPPATWDAATSRVRLRIDPGASAAGAGAAGWLRFPPRPRRAMVVPLLAVRRSSEGPYVLAADDDGAWRRRPVELGKEFSGYAAVVGGLREHERVATAGLFFLDAEERLERRVDRAGETVP